MDKLRSFVPSIDPRRRSRPLRRLDVT